MLPLHFEMSRITVQFQTPMVVGNGYGHDIADAVCVVDANGLPSIPGSSIAGVLRHAFAESRGEDPERGQQVCEWFGFADKKRGGRSKITVSWAALHDECNRPVEARDHKDGTDPVLRIARAGVIRDHVAIGEDGAVDGRRKFDERLVPAGVRMTFELRCDSSPPGLLREMVGLLRAPGIRLGRRSRSGLGAFDVVEVASRHFDLTMRCQTTEQAPRAGFEEWSRHPASLREPSPCLTRWAELPSPVRLASWRAWELALAPQDFLITGAGVPLDGDPDVDLFPLREARVAYAEDSGRVEEAGEAPWLLPGSSIKGALRHRTAFWLAVAHRAWIDGEDEPRVGVEQDLACLFGTAHTAESGVPGTVIIDDVLMRRATPWCMQHVRLDRFTQGPMDGMLYGEAPLWLDAPLVITVLLNLGELKKRTQSAARTDWLIGALQRAMDDLAQGRLALGGGANRGHGYFMGRVTDVE